MSHIVEGFRTKLRIACLASQIDWGWKMRVTSHPILSRLLLRFRSQGWLPIYLPLHLSEVDRSRLYRREGTLMLWRDDDNDNSGWEERMGNAKLWRDRWISTTQSTHVDLIAKERLLLRKTWRLCQRINAIHAEPTIKNKQCFSVFLSACNADLWLILTR